MNNVSLQSPKAQKEIIDAWEWYEDKQQGLGDRFLKEVHNKIKSIAANPLHYPLKGKYREAQINIFPYLIIFKVDLKNDVVLVVSVFHMSRHPQKK